MQPIYFEVQADIEHIETLRELYTMGGVIEDEVAENEFIVSDYFTPDGRLIVEIIDIDDLIKMKILIYQLYMNLDIRFGKFAILSLNIDKDNYCVEYDVIQELLFLFFLFETEFGKNETSEALSIHLQSHLQMLDIAFCIQCSLYCIVMDFYLNGEFTKQISKISKQYIKTIRGEPKSPILEFFEFMEKCKEMEEFKDEE